MSQSDKAWYFVTSLAKSLRHRGFDCPSCGHALGDIVSRKYGVTTLRRCQKCALLFRAPTSTENSLRNYYQQRYQSEFTTDLPDAETLTGYLRDGFAKTTKDFTRYRAIVQALGGRKGNRILDLGCSWGYGVWQFRKAGYDAFGLEISRERAAFAREQLGVPVVSDLDEIEGLFDIIFSAHVLEHIPGIRPILAAAQSRLRPNGLFVAITPNGSTEFRARSPAQWDRLWGLKHPLFLDAEFWRNTLDGMPYLLATNLKDFAAMTQWSANPAPVIGQLTGWELLAAFKKQSTKAFT